MIVSHEHKYIFVKTKKTAGTSLELALSRFVGKGDVVTDGLTDADEEIRAEIGGTPPQNMLIPPYRGGPKQVLRWVLRRRTRRFFSHMPASRIRKSVGSRTWDRYFTFAVIRNPWDLAVSAYKWSTRDDPTISFQDWLFLPGALDEYDNWRIYAIGDAVVVDQVYRYSELEEMWADLSRRLGIPGSGPLPRAKGQYRGDSKPYQEWYGGAERDRVAEVYGKEIRHFGWRFD